MDKTLDEFTIEASKHYRLTSDGELERISSPYEPRLKIHRFKMGVIKGSIGPYNYLRFKHRQEIGGKQRIIRVHRMVFLLHYGYLPQCVDHINNERLDNNPANLRAVTSAQNSSNRTSWKDSSSKYLGVNKSYDKWKAEIWIDGANKHLGSFEREVDAAKAYDVAALERYGEYANPNFPTTRDKGS
tara:strand:+ start:527 stop:1084 length:558 start_codon:yes stop_codon:yes gene_type:complete